jgi:hypothetical protein
MDSIRRMLSNPAAQVQGSNPNGNSGVTGGGGLAGVASKAQGHSIKAINDQVNYSLWEFYYDPTKDVKQVLPGGAGPQGATPGAANTPVFGGRNGNTPAATNTPATNPTPSNQNGVNPDQGIPPAYAGPPPPDTPPEQPEEPQ